MNKKWLKFSLYILIILTTVVLTSTVVLGYSYEDFRNSSGGSNGPAQVIEASVDFLAIIKAFGYILAIIFVFLLAIQFMIATPNKKAELKTRAWMYTLGIVLLISIPSIMDWMGDIGTEVNATGGTSGSGSSGTDLTEYVNGDSGSGGFLSFFANIFGKGKSSGGPSLGSSTSGGNTGGGGGTTPTNSGSTASGATPITGDSSITTPPESPGQAPVPTADGYVPTTATKPEDLKEGDYVYFTVDAGAKKPGDGSWTNENNYYKLKPGETVEYIENEEYKCWVVRNAGQGRRLGNYVASAGVNCFDGVKHDFDKYPFALTSDAL